MTILTTPTRNTRTRRTLTVLAPALALALVPLSPASATDDDRDTRRGPDTINLKRGSLPEGITSGPRDTFFAGSRRDGAVRQYSTRTGKRLRTLVPGRTGEVAVGMLYDAPSKRLFVAGGATGDLTVYDARNGKVLYTANTGEGRFINDVTVTETAAYFTDSTAARLYVVRLGKNGTLPRNGRFSTLRLRGDYVQPTGFGLNGIRDLPDGDLIVVSGGVLYTVSPKTGVADRVRQGGRDLIGGDGLELKGRTLYVVNGYGGDEVVQLRLRRDFTATSVTRVLDESDTTSDLDRPTTGALVDGDLFVVNGRFGTIATTTDGGARLRFTVSRLELG